MSKEVILMDNIEGLGKEGEVVSVADGYARNFLLPRKKAAPVTEATRRQLEKRREERAEELAAQLDCAKELAAKIETLSLTIPVKAGPEGKLFGSVSLSDVLSVLEEQGVSLEKNQIKLDDPLRELGVFNLPVSLHPDVDTTLKVWIVEE